MNNKSYRFAFPSFYLKNDYLLSVSPSRNIVAYSFRLNAFSPFNRTSTTYNFKMPATSRYKGVIGEEVVDAVRIIGVNATISNYYLGYVIGKEKGMNIDESHQFNLVDRFFSAVDTPETLAITDKIIQSTLNNLQISQQDSVQFANLDNYIDFTTNKVVESISSLLTLSFKEKTIESIQGILFSASTGKIYDLALQENDDAMRLVKINEGSNLISYDISTLSNDAVELFMRKYDIVKRIENEIRGVSQEYDLFDGMGKPTFVHELDYGNKSLEYYSRLDYIDSLDRKVSDLTANLIDTQKLINNPSVFYSTFVPHADQFSLIRDYIPSVGKDLDVSYLDREFVQELGEVDVTSFNLVDNEINMYLYDLDNYKKLSTQAIGQVVDLYRSNKQDDVILSHVSPLEFSYFRQLEIDSHIDTIDHLSFVDRPLVSTIADLQYVNDRKSIKETEIIESVKGYAVQERESLFINYNDFSRVNRERDLTLNEFDGSSSSAKGVFIHEFDNFYRSIPDYVLTFDEFDYFSNSVIDVDASIVDTVNLLLQGKELKATLDIQDTHQIVRSDINLYADSLDLAYTQKDHNAEIISSDHFNREERNLYTNVYSLDAGQKEMIFYSDIDVVDNSTLYDLGTITVIHSYTEFKRMQESKKSILDETVLHELHSDRESKLMDGYDFNLHDQGLTVSHNYFDYFDRLLNEHETKLDEFDGSESRGIPTDIIEFDEFKRVAENLFIDVDTLDISIVEKTELDSTLDSLYQGNTYNLMQAIIDDIELEGSRSYTFTANNVDDFISQREQLVDTVIEVINQGEKYSDYAGIVNEIDLSLRDKVVDVFNVDDTYKGVRSIIKDAERLHLDKFDRDVLMFAEQISHVVSNRDMLHVADEVQLFNYTRDIVYNSTIVDEYQFDGPEYKEYTWLWHSRPSWWSKWNWRVTK